MSSPDEISMGIPAYPTNTPDLIRAEIDPAEAVNALVEAIALLSSHGARGRPIPELPLRAQLVALFSPLVPENAQPIDLDDDESHEWWADVLTELDQEKISPQARRLSFAETVNRYASIAERLPIQINTGDLNAMRTEHEELSLARRRATSTILGKDPS